MHVALNMDRGWLDQPGARVRMGATDRIVYLTLSRLSLERMTEGFLSLRVRLDGVEALAVSPVGPGAEDRGLEFLLVMPRPARRATPI